MNYTKKFIKSESDLPAEGEYFCMLKNGTPAQCSFEHIVVEWWMDNVEYYFQSIPESPAQGMPSDEELKMQLHRILSDYYRRTGYPVESAIADILYLFKSRTARPKIRTDKVS
jgi:hypothetical protein